MEQAIVQFIVKAIAYGGGGAVVAYAIFTFLGKKWIENKLAERLEVYKHKLDEELERTRYKINSLFSRVSKIHEKEFEVLPEAWHKMHEALGRIAQLVSLVRYYPDLNTMGQPALREFLEKSRLHEFEKQELLEAKNKVLYYEDKIFWHDLRDVEEAFRDFHNYIIRNKIFLSLDLQEQFTKIDKILVSAIVQRKAGQEANGREMWGKAYEKINQEINPIMEVVEKLVQARLHYHEVD